MQIIIDIDENRYNLLKRQARTYLGREKMDEFAEAILNGTPLTPDVAVPKFIDQLKIKDMDRQYNAGMVSEIYGNYIIGYAMQGAENTFSIGQPVYDKDKNIMGWLGIGLFENLNYSANVRVPCEYWQICLPTKFCEAGKQVYTYWQMTGVEPQDGDAPTIIDGSEG